MKATFWSYLFTAVAVLFLIPHAASAQTWDGAGDGLNWADPVNWNPDTLLISGSPGLSLYIPNGGPLTTNQNVGGAFSLQQLMFSSPGPYTVNGGSIHFDNLGSTPSLATLGGGPNVTFNVPIFFNDSTLVNVSSVSFASGATVAATTTLNLQGTFAGGSILNNGVIQPDFANVSADISGPGSVNVTNFSAALTGNNSYTGGTTLGLGTQLNGNTSGIQGNVTMNNSQVSFQQNVAGSTAAVITGPGNVSIGGSGKITLTSVNSYSGTTIVSGNLGIGNNGSLSSSFIQVFTGGKISAEGGARTLANDIDFSQGLEIDGGNNLTFTDTSPKQLNSGGTPTLLHSSPAITEIRGAFTGAVNSIIDVQNGTLKLGAAVNNGFRMDGQINVAAGTTLELLSSNPVRFGATNLNGGTIIAANGVAVPTGLALTASGSIQGRAAAEAGSVIEATGTLTIGDATSFAGFFSSGELRVKDQTVTLNDKNQAVLGSLTEIGTGSNPGTLNISNGAFVDFGRGITGWGTVNSNNALADAMIINGSAEGTSGLQQLDFTGYVKGLGDFTNVTFSGTFSPGLSPTISPVNNVSFGSSNVLLIEIGGLTPGTQHDQLDITGVLGLNGTMDVDLILGFNPSLGDSFLIFDGTTSGAFTAFSFPGLDPGLSWDTSVLYTTGYLNVVPEPSTFVLAALGLLTLAGAARRRRR